MFDQAAEDMAGTGFTNMCPVASVAAEVAETVDELRGVTAGVFTGWPAGGTAYRIGRGLPEPIAREVAGDRRRGHVVARRRRRQRLRYRTAVLPPVKGDPCG